MKKFMLLILMAGMLQSIKAQVLDTSNPEVQASLNSAYFESSPLANFFQKRTPMMDKLFRQVKNDDEYITHYVGAEVGSAYEDDKFKAGKVYYREEYLGDFFYRHNAYNSEIELRKTKLKEEKQKALIKDKDVTLTDVQGNEMRFMTFITKKNKTKNGYLTLLVDGKKYKLYRRLAVKFTEAKPAANSMVNPIPSRFSHFVEYYLKEKNTDRIDEIPLQKGKFFKILGKRNKALEDFMKNKGSDLKVEEDLKEIIKFLNN